MCSSGLTSGRALLVQAAGRSRRRVLCMRGIVVNAAVLLALAADLSTKCEGYTSVLHWVELCMAGVAGANLVRLAAALLTTTTTTSTTTPITLQVRNNISDGDASDDSSSLSLSPAASRRHWRHSDRDTDRDAASISPTASPSPSSSPTRDCFISDRDTLRRYLRQYEADTMGVAGVMSLQSACGAPHTSSPPPQYRLAVPSPPPTAAGTGGGGAAAAGPEESTPSDCNTTSNTTTAALWGRLHVDPQRLTQFNLNLRLWLHATILSRVVRSMDEVDAALARLGLGAGLQALSADRARALCGGGGTTGGGALPQLLPYLEPFAERNYVVGRVRALAASGGCLAAYRWSGGGPGWHDGLPADADLVLHLLCTYLRAAGGGLPVVTTGGGGGGRHHHPALLRVRSRPPHYAVLLQDGTLEVPRGSTNMLHSVLLVLADAARRDPPVLHRLHLGPAGLNMLWIIGR